MGVYLSVGLVDEWQVNLGRKPYFGRLVGVIGAALDVQEVDTVVIVGVGWSDDSSVPIGESLVLSYDQSSIFG